MRVPRYLNISTCSSVVSLTLMEIDFSAGSLEIIIVFVFLTFIICQSSPALLLFSLTLSNVLWSFASVFAIKAVSSA